MNKLILNNIEHSYGNYLILDKLCLELISSEITCLIGESGAGKTTLLRIIAGLEKQSGGQIMLGDKVISDDESFVDTNNREIGLVVQERALFPHLKVIDNICFGLKGKKSEKIKRAEYLMNIFKICLLYTSDAADEE